MFRESVSSRIPLGTNAMTHTPVVGNGPATRTARGPAPRRRGKKNKVRLEAAERVLIFSDADSAFVEVTDRLIALYRGIERSTLDLPAVSITPFLIFMWANLKFWFFFCAGLFLIIPTNLVILIRNFFPGHWRYRPFFLSYFYYMWLWIWRGEAPTAPFILVRPLLNVFIKGHFERRLRRLRQEIALHDALSEATRSALTVRLDAALERWKSPGFVTILVTVVIPAIAYLQTSIEFVKSLGINIPSATLGISIPISTGGLLVLGFSVFGYFVAIPTTAFLGKRGLFIGRTPDRTCFAGEKAGSGFYAEERDILSKVGLRVRELPLDLWIVAFLFVLGPVVQLLTWDIHMEWTLSGTQMGSHDRDSLANYLLIQNTIMFVLFFGMLLIAAIRRNRTGRA
jgi:hypothetical protein